MSDGVLETERLLLRPSVVEDAEVFRRLWTERDLRGPAHRRIDADGRPSVQDIAERIAGQRTTGPQLLTVLRDDEVIGYCGLTSNGHGTAEEPELAYELLRQPTATATPRRRRPPSWSGRSGAATPACGPGCGIGTWRHGGCWRSSRSSRCVGNHR